MNTKKLLTGVITGVMVTGIVLMNTRSFASNMVNADVNFEKIQRNDLSQAMGIDTQISVNDYIVVDGSVIPLYCTFENKNEAIEEIKQKAETLLNLVKEKYSLSDDLNEENWENYREKVNQYITEYNAESEYFDEYSNLLTFFDIYENEDQNNEIKQYSTKARSTTMKDELAAMLPYDSESTLVKNFNEKALKVSEKLNQARSYSLNNAIVYANKYATSPNKTDYAYFSTGDCTNFTSQILEAAGVSQEVYDSENSGWWHKVSTGAFGIKNHTHSISWIRAKTFARYMGIGLNTNNHWDFSASLQKGDFVAFDKAADGDVDHNAFVVDRDNYAANYNGMNYYNYKIAQHTSNYCAWASSDTNNWEKLEDYTCRFIRVRR